MKKNTLNINGETVVAFLALIVSLISLYFSLQIEKNKASSNVQIDSVTGMREHYSDNSIRIKGSLVLINVGNAPTQIVDVHWEVANITSSNPQIDGWIGISDIHEPYDLQFIDHFENIKDTPIQGIDNTIIEAGETISLKLMFRSAPIPDTVRLENVRIIFTFSNGQELTTLPEINSVRH